MHILFIITKNVKVGEVYLMNEHLKPLAFFQSGKKYSKCFVDTHYFKNFSSWNFFNLISSL